MKFIKNKHNNGIVNLDLVTSIYPSKGRCEGAPHKIHFNFDAMSEEAFNEITWEFKKLEDMEAVLSKIEILEV